VSTHSGIQGITEQDIANYLVQTPSFFERHAQLLASISLASPHGQRAVSLQERQMQMLRDKHKGLEQRIIEMMRHSQDNLSLADKLHHCTRAMLLTKRSTDLPEVLVSELKNQFLIPKVSLRLWGFPPSFERQPFTATVSEDARAFAASLGAPYCGLNSGFEACQWFVEPETVVSVALIPLRKEKIDSAVGEADDESSLTFGMLVLGSPDPTRYSPDMGTEFLVRMGDIASAGLSRLLTST
jgi:uncharacterized protein